jgi:hypothetical protein
MGNGGQITTAVAIDWWAKECMAHGAWAGRSEQRNECEHRKRMDEVTLDRRKGSSQKKHRKCGRMITQAPDLRTHTHTHTHTAAHAAARAREPAQQHSVHMHKGGR